MLAAGAVGYVLGTRAGRERYEQIKAGAQRVSRDPRVRAKAKEAGDAVRENAPVVKDKVADAAAHAKETVQAKTSHGQGQPAGAGPITGVDPTTNSAQPSA